MSSQTVVLPKTKNVPTTIVNNAGDNFFLNNSPLTLGKETPITVNDVLTYGNKYGVFAVPFYNPPPSLGGVVGNPGTNSSPDFYLSLYLQGQASTAQVAANYTITCPAQKKVIALFQDYISKYPLLISPCYINSSGAPSFQININGFDNVTPVQPFFDKAATWPSANIIDAVAHFDAQGNIDSINVTLIKPNDTGLPITVQVRTLNFFSFGTGTTVTYNNILGVFDPPAALGFGTGGFEVTYQYGSQSLEPFAYPGLWMYFAFVYVPNYSYQFRYWFAYYPNPSAYPVTPPNLGAAALGPVSTTTATASAPRTLTVHHYHHFM